MLILHITLMMSLRNWIKGKITKFTKLYYFSVVCRALAHFYSLTAAWEMIQFTTQKYQKELVSLSTQQFCLQISVQLFHNLISKLYLNSVNFNMNTRTDIQNMIHLIKNSFEQLLNANTWMDPVTKKIAKEKLLAIQSNVAAPDIVFDDERLEKDSAEVCYSNLTKF